jgi:hypothetical protein
MVEIIRVTVERLYTMFDTIEICKKEIGEREKQDREVNYFI